MTRLYPVAQLVPIVFLAACALAAVLLPARAAGAAAEDEKAVPPHDTE